MMDGPIEVGQWWRRKRRRGPGSMYLIVTNILVAPVRHIGVTLCVPSYPLRRTRMTARTLWKTCERVSAAEIERALDGYSPELDFDDPIPYRPRSEVRKEHKNELEDFVDWMDEFQRENPNVHIHGPLGQTIVARRRMKADQDGGDG
jgi:hypothetical protein